MRRHWQRKIGVLLCLSLGFGLGSTTQANQPYEDEYRASTGLDLIRASDAYALGYTGKGITLGVADEFAQLTHVEFKYKSNSKTITLIPSGYWEKNKKTPTHGTHVGGIMAAAKDGFGMHGVAFDANLWSGDVLSAPQNTNLKKAYDGFNSNKDIKIINNSWGTEAYIDVAGKPAFSNKDFQATLDILQKSIKDYDKVLVFAAGNSGHPTPGGESTLSYLRPQTASNFINVVSVDPAKYKYDSKENKWIADISFTSEFSDLAKYVHENTIAAPGSDIYSTISHPSASGQYSNMSGTSMAAPHVSGVAGLVQQAFPYMSGKQIVDTVLSTAYRDFELPKYTITTQNDEQESGETTRKVNIYYFGAKQPKEDQIKEDLEDYSEGLSSWNRTVYDYVPRELIFGQGLLDAGAAVKGPALLDARRLDSSSRNSTYGKTQALYSINTQGYPPSTWKNDIGERRAGFLDASSPYDDLKTIFTYYNTQGGDKYSLTQGKAYITEYNTKVKANKLIENPNDPATKGLPVGLIKFGEGTLTLSGNNTYQGSTVAAGGILQINGSVKGDAWSTETGTISGNGTIGTIDDKGKIIIKSNLYNGYNVRAGIVSEDKKISPGILKVTGDFESYSKFISVIIDSSNRSGQLAVAGTAAINGSMLVPYTDMYLPHESYSDILTATKITGKFTDFPLTGFLTAVGTVENGNSATLSYRQENNLANPTTRQSETYNRMIAIYDSLKTQEERQAMYPLLNLKGSMATRGLTEISGGSQLNQAAAVQSDTFIGTAVAARMDYVNQPAGQNMTFLLPGFAPGTFAVNTIVPLEVGSQNSWWMKAIKNWGSNDAQQDLPGIDNRSYGLVVGQDRKVNDHWRLGYLMGYGQNHVTSTIAATDSHGYRLGVYGGYSKGSFDLHTYLDYGRHSNHAARYIRTLGLQSDSNYNSNTLSFGIGARYNLHAKKDKLWQVSPYADLYISRYNQNGYQEAGAGDTYDQIADPLANTYSTGEIGLEIARAIPKGRYAFHVGYKKVLSGSNPEMTVAYTIKPTDKITVSGSEQDREYLVLGLSLQGQLAKDLTIDSQLNHQRGSSSRNLTATVTLRKMW